MDATQVMLLGRRRLNLGVRPSSASVASDRSRSVVVSGFGKFQCGSWLPASGQFACARSSLPARSSRRPSVRSGSSLPSVTVRQAATAFSAQPGLQSVLPRLSVRPNHSFKPTAGDGRDISHASWAGGGLTKALGHLNSPDFYRSCDIVELIDSEESEGKMLWHLFKT